LELSVSIPRGMSDVELPPVFSSQSQVLETIHGRDEQDRFVTLFSCRARRPEAEKVNYWARRLCWESAPHSQKDARPLGIAWGCPAEDQRDGQDIGPHGLLFGRPNAQPTVLKQEFRKRTLRIGNQSFPASLFGGAGIELRQHQENVWRVKVQTSLNPTRFIRHQRLPPFTHPFPGTPPPFEVCLFKRKLGARDNDEFPLCDGDNWILTSHLLHVASQSSWPTQVRRFLTLGVEKLLSS
jgi:hypothetical protein